MVVAWWASCRWTARVEEAQHSTAQHWSLEAERRRGVNSPGPSSTDRVIFSWREAAPLRSALRAAACAVDQSPWNSAPVAAPRAGR